MVASKPVIHGRDHEHGGADTVGIHYETVGTSGTTRGLRAWYSNGGGDAIPNNNTDPMTWALVSGDDLLDLTFPTAPEALVTGVYAITLNVYSFTVMTSGAIMDYALYINGGEAFSGGRTYQIGTASPPNASASLVWFCEAGRAIQATVGNHDGASTRTFVHNTFVELVG